ncbi:MAG: chemotaxis protein CheV [Proteobacteria bacterium]|uniref:Chemotaxis protein CheV n=1 Tax=Candidatus Avisuccinivibrio stercorigallinarum TaxID=2840704 RepID=A0A9D9GT25_9GAMM|nr:chemotaxis protein CheV [Candidatus Avisuccinivibrio stercorigallinarum]
MAGVMDSVNQLTELVGQNRMELLLFRLSGLNQRYGINVFKVREVLPCPRLTVMPKLHQYVIGIAHIRGQTLSVIDLAYAIGGKPTQDVQKHFIIIAEYNRSTHAFLVSNVERILNMNWNKIMPPPKGAGHSNYMTAVTEIDNELVEILDVEKILDEISPTSVSVSSEVMDKATEAGQKIPEHVKVLVADDSKVAIKQVERAMQAIGVDIVKASDGKEALEILHAALAKGPIRNSFELVISDVEMPEMDGYTLCASIRQDPALKDLYVILHTSLSGVFNQSMVSKAGANDFIPKFNPDELAGAVERGIKTVEQGISGADCIMTKKIG